MTPQALAFCLALAIPAAISLAPATAHADVGSLCGDLDAKWKKATGAKGNKRQIAELRDQIEQMSPSCPTLWSLAKAYRPPADKIVRDDGPEKQQIKIQACLADIVRQATTVADRALKVEREALASAKQAELRAAQEHASHPNRASAPPEGKWTYSDGVTVSYWGDTVANSAPTGYGVMEYSDGRRSSGLFKDGVSQGPAVFKYKGGELRSDFVNAVATGPGVADFGDTRHAMIVDTSAQNKYHIVIFSDGSVFKGLAVDKNYESPGVMYSKSGEIVKFGIFRNYTNFVHSITKSDCTP